MLALKRAMILGIAVFLIVWAAILSIGQVAGAGGALPPTPTLVSPANNAWVTENKPTFKWFFNGNQSGFNLSISNQMDFATLVQNITRKSSAQNYTLTTALNDGTYYWKVRINDTSGVWSYWSAVWLVKVDTTPPTSVTVSSLRTRTELKIGSGGSLAELKIAGGEFVELNWTQSDDPYFMQYEIYVSTNQSALARAIAMHACNATITSVGSTTCVYPSGSLANPEALLGLDPGKTYYFSVVVVDQAGLSSESATVSVTTRAPMNWPLMGGIAIAVELAIGAIFVVFKLFIKKK